MIKRRCCWVTGVYGRYTCKVQVLEIMGQSCAAGLRERLPDDLLPGRHSVGSGSKAAVFVASCPLRMNSGISQLKDCAQIKSWFFDVALRVLIHDAFLAWYSG